MVTGATGRYDVIVIGGGHNGLTAAAMLAKRGRKVLVLERRDVIGGLAAREEFHPGFHTDGTTHDSMLFDQNIVEELKLSQHGFQTAEPSPVHVPARDGPGLLLHHDPAQARTEIAAVSEKDASRYEEYRTFIGRVRPFFRRLLCEIPPDASASGWGGFMTLAQTGLALRRLGRRDMMEVLRVGPMCVADWLNEWFESDALKCALALPAVAHSSTGPWSPGTNAMLLRHEVLANRAAPNGPAAVIDALVNSCQAFGVDLRTRAEVHRVRVDNGAVQGVMLADGESIDASIIASSCDPKRVFIALLDRHDVPAHLEGRMTKLRASGTTVKVNLALDGPLRFACRPELEVERAVIAESLDAMERAFDSIKYRQLPEKPILDIRVPTISHPDLAPEGKHVVSVLAHFVPYDLESGWTDESRDLIGDRVVGRLAEYAPDVTDRIIAREVLTPGDIESRYGVTGGHLHHVEHGLDQMIARPVPECARYATPIKGLYLCGSGSHPGGGITGLPGRLAAQAIVRDQ